MIRSSVRPGMVIMDIIKCEAALFNKDQQVDCGIVLRRNFQHFGPEIGMTEFTSHHVLLGCSSAPLLMLLFGWFCLVNDRT